MPVRVRRVALRRSSSNGRIPLRVSGRHAGETASHRLSPRTAQDRQRVLSQPHDTGESENLYGKYRCSLTVTTTDLRSGDWRFESSHRYHETPLKPCLWPPQARSKLRHPAGVDQLAEPSASKAECWEFDSPRQHLRRHSTIGSALPP